MTRYNEKSILKSKLITDVLQNEKDHTYGDFKFVVIKNKEESTIMPRYTYFGSASYIEVYNFDVMILKIRYDKRLENKFNIKIVFFNPQTNNDCQSINHIIGKFKELCYDQHFDAGNACVINNQYVFRQKDNFYSYAKVWAKGEVSSGNYNKELSHEFATEEYINYIKKVFGFSRMPRRDLKKKIKAEISGAIAMENKRLLLDSLDENKKKRWIN